MEEDAKQLKIQRNAIDFVSPVLDKLEESKETLSGWKEACQKNDAGLRTAEGNLSELNEKIDLFRQKKPETEERKGDLRKLQDEKENTRSRRNWSRSVRKKTALFLRLTWSEKNRKTE